MASQKDIVEKYRDLGEKWMSGEISIEGINLGEIEIDFSSNPKQMEFTNSKKKYVLNAGGYGSGKTLALLVKMLFLCLFFPGNRVLLGRATMADIERNTLPEFMELVPPSWYKHKKKDGIIKFFNGSEIILFGLDALRSGSQKDIRKAEQKLKSLNLGAYFIDQLEEVDYDVFKTLNSRLRRKNVPLRQGNMTCNPANFWAYNYFIIEGSENDNRHVIMSSMLDNRANLPEDYIEDQLDNPEEYVERYVYGSWDINLLISGSVFEPSAIEKMEKRVQEPQRVVDGIEIFKEPREEDKIFGENEGRYQMGVDPSEGVIDPSSITVVDTETGEKVARYNGKIPISVLAKKVEYLHYLYNECLIIPEVNSMGIALLEEIKDLKVYKRKVYEYKHKKRTEKLGWKTSHQTKSALVSHFQELVRKGFPVIYDKNTIEEMKVFVWSDAAKQKGAGASPGFHDDDVMSTMLAYWNISPKDKIKIEKRKIRRKKKYRTNKFSYQYN